VGGLLRAQRSTSSGARPLDIELALDVIDAGPLSCIVILVSSTLATRVAINVRRHSRLALMAIVAVVSSACVFGSGAAPSVWVDNRSSQSAAFFLTGLGDGPAGWFIVAAHTTAHAGSDGLGSTAVRANVLGWGHEANHVSECSPSDYDDTLYDVPPGASVRLLIEATGEPSVALMAEPSGLPVLPAQPIMGTFNEADLCQYIRAHS
jgi:hypothetical protein